MRMQLVWLSPRIPLKNAILEMKSSQVTAAKLFNVDETVLKK